MTTKRPMHCQHLSHVCDHLLGGVNGNGSNGEVNGNGGGGGNGGVNRNGGSCVNGNDGGGVNGGGRDGLLVMVVVMVVQMVIVGCEQWF